MRNRGGTVAFHTLGCRLNQAESAEFAGQFRALGYREPRQDENHSEPDIVVVHTCVITGAAEKESLRLLRSLKRKHPEAMLVFAGCATAAIEAGKIREQGADLIISQDRKDQLAAITIAKLNGNNTPGSQHHECLSSDATPHFSTARAWVKVQDGCDFRCAYCIIPDMRGAPRSRPLEAISRQTDLVAQRGFREIVLTGVNLGCYGTGDENLTQLVKKLLALPHSFRLRLGSLEPGTVEREIADMAAGEPRICRMLHLPLQSGDPGILRAMRRRYTVDEYERTLEHILRKIPLLAIGADVIAGFPGESEKAFENTCAIIKRYPFSNLHVFPYSERPGTPAAEMPGAVPQTERRARAAHLREIAGRKRREYARRFIGREVEMLVERVDEHGNGFGWTAEYLEAEAGGLTRNSVGELLQFTPSALSDAGALIS